VLFDRKFKRWAGWPFYGSPGGRVLKSVVDWFEEVRNDYDGPLRRRFDRIQTDSSRHR